MENVKGQGYHTPSLEDFVGPLFTLHELAALLALLEGFFPKEGTAFMEATKSAYPKLISLITQRYKQTEPALRELIETFRKDQSRVQIFPDGS